MTRVPSNNNPNSASGALRSAQLQLLPASAELLQFMKILILAGELHDCAEAGSFLTGGPSPGARLRDIAADCGFLFLLNKSVGSRPAIIKM